jgi:hypothetical protein
MLHFEINFPTGVQIGEMCLCSCNPKKEMLYLFII